MSDDRARNWTFIVYPEDENCPDNWLERLQNLHTPFAISPYHNMDVNPDGEQKKPHYHVCFCFSGLKSYEQICEICEDVNAPIPKRVGNVKGMIRYFAHLDNPEKAQYPIEEVKGFCGFDVPDYMKPSTTEKHIILKDILKYVREKNILYYGDLIEYTMIYREDWFSILAEGYTYVVDSVIKSNRMKYRDLREAQKEAEDKQNAS